MNRPLYFNLVMLAMISAPLTAQENQQDLPSMALLTYLAEMAEVDGELVGPQEMQSATCTEAEKNGNGSDNAPKKNPQDNNATNSDALEQECKPQ